MESHFRSFKTGKDEIHRTRLSEAMEPSLSRTGTRASLSKVNRDSNFSVPGRWECGGSVTRWKRVILGSSTHACKLFEEEKRKIPNNSVISCYRQENVT